MADDKKQLIIGYAMLALEDWLTSDRGEFARDNYNDFADVVAMVCDTKDNYDARRAAEYRGYFN